MTPWKRKNVEISYCSRKIHLQATPKIIHFTLLTGRQGWQLARLSVPTFHNKELISDVKQTAIQTVIYTKKSPPNAFCLHILLSSPQLGYVTPDGKTPSDFEKMWCFFVVLEFTDILKIVETYHSETKVQTASTNSTASLPGNLFVSFLYINTQLRTGSAIWYDFTDFFRFYGLLPPL